MVQRRGFSANAVCELVDANGNAFDRLVDEPTTVRLPIFADQPMLAAYAEEFEAATDLCPHVFDISATFTARADRGYMIEVTTPPMGGSSIGLDYTLTLEGLDTSLELAGGNDWLKETNDRYTYVFRRRVSGLTAGSKTLRLAIDETAGGAAINSSNDMPFTITVTEVPLA